MTRFWPVRLEGNWLLEFWERVSVLRIHRKGGPFLSLDVVMSRYDARNRCGHLMRGTRMRPNRQHAEDDEAKRQKDPGS